MRIPSGIKSTTVSIEFYPQIANNLSECRKSKEKHIGKSLKRDGDRARGRAVSEQCKPPADNRAEKRGSYSITDATFHLK